MKIIGIGGEPATGKTTIMRELIRDLGPWRPFSFSLVRGLWFDEAKAVVLGIYDEKLFCGTDRLSMAVQRSAEMFLTWCAGSAKLQDFTIIFEGDRLFNAPTMRLARSLGPSLFLLLDVSEEEKAKRHLVRGDNQSTTFQKSRRTKCQNLLDGYPFIERFPNEHQEHQRRVLERIRQFADLSPSHEGPVPPSLHPGPPPPFPLTLPEEAPQG